MTVGGSNCANVSVNLSHISCTLPPGTGTSRPVTVSSGGSTSTPVYASYDLPKISKLEGGLGCEPDLSVENTTKPGSVCMAIYSADGSVFEAAVKNCDRNGSDSEALTIIGDNFGAIDVPVTVKLQGVTINVTKDTKEPHRKMYTYLPPGPGSGARLPLTVMVDLQLGGALVSYEPCAAGRNAECVNCEPGRSEGKSASLSTCCCCLLSLFFLFCLIWLSGTGG